MSNSEANYASPVPTRQCICALHSFYYAVSTHW